jgi:hypothetical protein
MKKNFVLTLLFVSVVLCIYACSGGGSDSTQSSVPPAAQTMDTELKANMARSLPLVAPVENSLLFVMNPGTVMAQGVTVSPDLTPGALPNSVIFAGPFDGNGDGLKETTMSGKATFSSDPAAGWDGMNGQAAVDVTIPLVGHLYHADIAFSINSGNQHLLSGSGKFTNPLSGNVTTMSATATPLVIKPATGAAGAVANACGYSLDGQMQLKVEGSTGTLTSLWNFSSNNPTVAVSGASFTDPLGQTTALPDSTADLRCGSSGSINDWVATYIQDYSCLPREVGQAKLTITVSGPDTIAISDEDPPGSGIVKNYSATVLPGNPHAIRGFFIGGPAGNHYREDFNWTLGKNGSNFSQFSAYKYTEGPNIGTGGICAAAAKRVP